MLYSVAVVALSLTFLEYRAIKPAMSKQVKIQEANGNFLMAVMQVHLILDVAALLLLFDLFFRIKAAKNLSFAILYIGISIIITLRSTWIRAQISKPKTSKK
ncbi:MAG: hypothetical protein EZS28_005795 [Streblomastix strix]|uniref:Uncharacterized protein n=1 Tax=Streblomastix strix TaxID=222440 RepID=A0A5J4WUT9_9EUKA|nr:MAG: hypothetical protein EZS28_005795 [Streblomastix strix]